MTSKRTISINGEAFFRAFLRDEETVKILAGIIPLIFNNI
jgi:hypothetical protein